MLLQLLLQLLPQLLHLAGGTARSCACIEQHSLQGTALPLLPVLLLLLLLFQLLLQLLPHLLHLTKLWRWCKLTLAIRLAYGATPVQILPFIVNG